MRKAFFRHLHYSILLLGISLILIPSLTFAEDGIDYTEAASIVDTEEILDEISADGNNLEDINDRFLTKRLIVLASKIDDTYGAVNEWQTDENEIVLEYDTAEKAQAAYKQLKKKYRCYPDEVLCIETSGDSTDVSLGMSALRNTPLERAVTVAVLDTGIDKTRGWFTKGGNAGGRVSSASYDFIKDTSTISDPVGHGTNVAGVVAMNTPDNVTILSCTVLDKENSSDTKLSTLLLIGSALRYAQANGADVINMSFDLEPVSGSSSSLDYLNDIIEDAYANGVICTVASGNDGRQITQNNYPACLGTAVTVGSVNANGALSEFSNYGKQLDFVAPGELSDPKVSGTSFAAPCIASCFAYLKGNNDDTSPSAMIEDLRSICTDLGETGKDDQYGWGLPDMSKLALDTEHHYEKTIQTPASCTEEGLAVYQCTDQGCSASYDEVIPKTDHTWKAVSDASGLHLECQNKGCSAVSTADDLSGTLGGGSNVFSWEIVSGGTNSSNMPVARLEISGNGDIPAQEDYPWKIFSDYITTIVLSDEISGIPENAFSGMKSLGSIEYTDDMADGRRYNGFSPSMTNIGPKAFFDCDTLKSISIGAGVSSIGVGAFSGCDSLQRVSVEDGNSHFKAEDGFLYTQNGAELLLCVGDDGVIKDSVNNIEQYAFYGSDITSLVIPASVAKIGSEAFSGCHSLRSVTFNGSDYMTIGDNAFKDVNADAYYPEDAGSASWLGQSYGGTLRWHMANLYDKNLEVTLTQTEYTFTGEPIVPEVIVKLAGTDTVLQEGTDYRLVCSNNVSPGTAEVKIIGTDETYSGILVRNFTIEKASFTFKKLEVPESVYAGSVVDIKYDGKSVKDMLELEIHYDSTPADLFHTEDDGSGRVDLIAGKSGSGTLIVTVDENEFYEADIVKKYPIQVLPCTDSTHKWDAGKIISKATYTKAGVKRSTCTVCGKTKDTAIARLKGAAVGSSNKVGAYTYKVKSSSSVEMIKAPNAKSITVPATVTINKKKYNVVSLGSKVFYKKSKLQTLTIGAKVTTIGANACNGCKKLNKVTIKGTVLKKVGSGAMKNIHKKAVVKVPKSKVKAYRKLLKKAGLNGKYQKVTAL